MRRDADADARAVVDEEVARFQGARDEIGIRHLDQEVPVDAERDRAGRLPAVDDLECLDVGAVEPAADEQRRVVVRRDGCQDLDGSGPWACCARDCSVRERRGTEESRRAGFADWGK